MFPFELPIRIKDGFDIEPEKIVAIVGPLLTSARKKKIDQVIDGRTFQVSIVLENIYDRGNASAVMRTAEALGLVRVYMVEVGEKFKESQRTTAGADKWIELHRYKSTRACLQEIKKDYSQIVVTDLRPGAQPIEELDFTKPTAFVLGNEKDGVSEEMLAAATHRVVLPMTGFVQSYNISVAGALSFYQIYMDRRRRQGFHGDLSSREKMVLRAHYYLRTQSSAEELLLEKRSRGEI